MQQVLSHTRLAIGLSVLIVLARIEASSLPPIAPRQEQSNQRHTGEIEAEVAHLAAQLKSGNTEERREAVMRLSRLEGQTAASALISALADSSPSVRAHVLAALGERSETSAVPFVVSRLTSDKDPFVRKAAAYALARFLGSERTSALIGALKDKDLEVRGAAAVSLGAHPDASAVPALAVALFDKSDFVRAQTARALGVNGRAAAPTVPALINLLLSDPDREVKRQAATALGLIGDRSALPALERARDDSDSYLAGAARDSIRMIERTK
jgi:HEAT repeat protein